MSDHRNRIRQEFTRTARTFAERTAGRFDHMGVVEFSRLAPGATVLEVGAGTGNFLSLFDSIAARLIAADVTPAMLAVGRNRNSSIAPVVCAGESLPLRTGTVDLASCAQMLHHVHEPVPILEEMRRVSRSTGYVLVVDQVVPADDRGMADTLTELEIARDPTHARSRTASEMRSLLREAGLEIIDEKIVTSTDRFSNWMDPREFPEDRIKATREFIESRGHETGLNFRAEGRDIIHDRSRIMLLAKP